MTAPVIAASTTSSTSSNAALHTISCGTPSAGDLLIVGTACDGTSAHNLAIDKSVSGKLWTSIRNSSANGAAFLFAKIAEGGGADQLQLISNQSTRAISYCLRITGHGGYAAVATSSASTGNADPPNVAITGAAQDVLFLAFMMMVSRATVSAGPSGYGSFTTDNVGVLSSGTTIAKSTLAASSATSNDAGAFTNPSTVWLSFAVAIPENAITTNARDTQVVMEAVSTFTNRAVFTQVPLEVASPQEQRAIITQVPLEVLSGDPWPSLSNPNKYRQIQIAC